MSIAVLFVVVAVVALATVIYIRRRNMSVLERNGIGGPKPHLIYGELHRFKHKNNVAQYSEYLEKYGKTCGYYNGRKPVVLTIDLELIKRIQIKDFHNFSDRQNFGIKHGFLPDPKLRQSIIHLKGIDWKDSRAILNPTFSASKLKSMTPIIESCIDILMGKVEQNAQEGSEFDVYQFFQTLTTDVIAKCALGIDTDVQNNPNDEFFKAAQEIFSRRLPFIQYFMCFPELDLFLYPIRRLIQMISVAMGNEPDSTIRRLVKTAIQLRGKSSSGKKNDLLQLMLDSKMSEEDIRNTNATNLSIEMGVETNGESQNYKRNENVKLRSLTENQVVSNAILFYEAGYETTSTALGFILYVLVNWPEIQEKVREEVNELYEKEKKFDYNTVNKLTYMQCVVNETLRFYPPITNFVTRNTIQDYPYKDIVIPREASVRVPTYQLHHCADYWPEPEKFDPERFRDKKNYDPNAFQPFGNGPRNCIGMRFALYEIKLCLAKMLFKYRFVPGPSTEKDLTIEYKSISETPKYGVFVKAIPLEN